MNMPKKHDTPPLTLLNKTELTITMRQKLTQDYAKDNYWKILTSMTRKEIGKYR
jgi:hypothetical protein